MATLLKTPADIQEHLNIGFNFEWENIESFVKQSERQHVKTIVGDSLYTTWTTTAPTDAVEKSAFDLFKEASANLATFKYIPTGSLSITDSGIHINASEYTKAPEWWQVRDLQRSLVDNAFYAIDEALKIMEASPTKFTGWDTTEGYTIFKELIVPKTQDFHRHFNISNSRQTFLALRAYQLEIQHKIFNWLGGDTLALLLSTSTDSVIKEAQELARAAQVNHTVATAVQSGIFKTTATGMYVKILELPGDKTTPATEEQLNRLANSRQQAGDEYLKKLKTLIEANPDKFPDYTVPGSTTFVDVHNTKSIVSF